MAEYVDWCETCDVVVTWQNCSKHPNGLGGHVVAHFEVIEDRPPRDSDD